MGVTIGRPIKTEFQKHCEAEFYSPINCSIAKEERLALSPYQWQGSTCRMQ